MRIELATNKVAQVIHFGEDVALQGSYLNDVRFHPDGSTAFITDSGARGAIVVVDLESGRAHARLDGHPSTQPEKGVEVSVGGQKLQRPDGRGFVVGADGIALSVDGRTLYWQALTGRTLYRADTAALMSDNQDDAAKSATKVGTTNVADGLLMSRDGWLFLTSPEDNSVKLWTGDRSETVISRSASQLARQSGGRPRRLDLCGGFAAARNAVVPARRRKRIADQIAPPRPHIEVTAAQRNIRRPRS